MYHRFVPDESKYIKAMRLFQGEPIWTPVAPNEQHQVRKAYVRKHGLDRFVCPNESSLAFRIEQDKFMVVDQRALPKTTKWVQLTLVPSP
jgi:hypothetical protein